MPGPGARSSPDDLSSSVAVLTMRAQRLPPGESPAAADLRAQLEALSVSASALVAAEAGVPWSSGLRPPEFSVKPATVPLLVPEDARKKALEQIREPSR